MNTTNLTKCEILELQGVFMLKRDLVNPMRIDHPDGVFYRGETNAAGLRHGWGEILYPSNTVMACKWVNGVGCGKGVYMSSTMTYKGDFYNDKFHGKGKLVYHDDGDVYEGEFVNDERVGYGKMTGKNGNIYVGYWADNALRGVGCLTTQTHIYRGHWVEDCQGDCQLRKDGIVIPK